MSNEEKSTASYREAQFGRLMREVLTSPECAGVDAVKRLKVWLHEEDEVSGITNFALCARGAAMHDVLNNAYTALRTVSDDISNELMAVSVSNGLYESPDVRRDDAPESEFAGSFRFLEEAVASKDFGMVQEAMKELTRYFADETFSGGATMRQIHEHAEDLYEGVVEAEAALEEGELKSDVLDILRGLIAEVRGD